MKIMGKHFGPIHALPLHNGQVVQVPARRVPGILGAQAHGSTGRVRFDYILGEDGQVLYGEDNNSLIKDN